MPAGKVHHEYHQRYLPHVGFLSAFLFLFGLMSSSYISVAAVWIMLWYISGRWIDPDWDLIGITEAEGRMMNELGYLGVLLLPVTTFYAANIRYFSNKFRFSSMFGGHRSKMSHSWPLGTAGRQLLICFLLAGMVNSGNVVLQHTFGGTLTWHPLDIAAFLIGQFIGLTISDSIHLLLDKYYGGK